MKVTFFLRCLMIILCFSLGCSEKREHIRETATIAKGWWPAWDMFQLGINEFEKEHNSCKTTFYQTSDYVSALAAFKDGKADAATLTIYEALLAASENVDLKIVLLLDYTIGSDGVVAKKSIRSLRELKGKKVGIEKGSIAHFTVLKALEKGGLTQQEVTLIEYDLDSLQQAFIDGEVDAIGSYDPYMTRMKKEGDGWVIFSSAEIPTAICDVLFVSKKLLDNSPGMISYWLQSWDNILKKQLSEKSHLLRRLSKVNNTPVDVLQSSLANIYLTDATENYMAFGGGSTGYLYNSVKEMEEFMYREGVIKTRVNCRALIDPAFIHQLYNR